MQVAVLGFGSQGLSAFEYWTKLGHDVTICDGDSSIVIPGGTATQLGDNYLDGLEKYDVIVRSPSIHPSDIKTANPEAVIEDRVTSNTNEFFNVCPTRNIIGITGTKGKGTTSTLTTRMLEAAGHKVHLGGNIGIPPLELLKENIQPDDWVVLELANFQLIDIKYSPAIAACLMIASEHQDWHSSFEEYTTAKQQLFVNQTEDDLAIYFTNDEHSRQIVSASKGTKIPYFATPGAYVDGEDIYVDGTHICRVNEVKLLGAHNLQNVCAALTVAWQVTQDTEALRSVISSFEGLEHRLEFVRNLEGVEYYDDSFGTTPETAIVAIEAFKEPKIVILGGSDKGADFRALAHVVAENNVKHVVAIGVTGPSIVEAIKQASAGDQVSCSLLEGKISMKEIVGIARKHTVSGDVVLLSTGCASFGLFQNYKDRGQQFKQVVSELG